MRFFGSAPDLATTSPSSEIQAFESANRLNNCP